MFYKTKNFTFTLFAILIFLCTSCLKEHELVSEISGIPAGGILDAEIKTVVGPVVTFRLDLFAVNHYGKFIENLDKSCFDSDDDDLDVNITEIGPGTNDNGGAYSAMLLFDQSSSISNTDPMDARIDAGKAFINIMDDGDEVGIDVFPTDSPYSEFTTDQDSLINLIEEMRGTNVGFTPLYSSIYGLIEYVADEAKNENKAIIVFTDGKGNDEGYVDDVIDFATQLGVAIYTIGLGSVNSLDFYFLTDIATSTGGAVMYAQDALQLISLYNSLSDFLHGDGIFYESCWEARKANGEDWQSGEEVITTILLHLSGGEVIEYPVKLTIP